MAEVVATGLSAELTNVSVSHSADHSPLLFPDTGERAAEHIVSANAKAKKITLMRTLP